MDNLTSEDRDDICAFVNNEDGSYPTLADLPAWWDITDPNAHAPELPNYSARDVLIASYMNWAFTKRWAWDGLNRLLATLQDRREPIPNILKDWACSVVSRQFKGSLKVPAKTRNPRYGPKDERDYRINRVYHTLRKRRWTVENVIGEIALACSLPEATVRSILRKMRHRHPFKKATIKAA